MAGTPDHPQTTKLPKALAGGLSSAEQAVVTSLCRGLNPQEIAEERNVSVNTVRTQLKAVFRKTNTHRQAELVSLALMQQVKS